MKKLFFVISVLLFVYSCSLNDIIRKEYLFIVHKPGTDFEDTVKFFGNLGGHYDTLTKEMVIGGFGDCVAEAWWFGFILDELKRDSIEIGVGSHKGNIRITMCYPSWPEVETYIADSLYGKMMIYIDTITNNRIAGRFIGSLYCEFDSSYYLVEKGKFGVNYYVK